MLVPPRPLSQLRESQQSAARVQASPSAEQVGAGVVVVVVAVELLPVVAVVLVPVVGVVLVPEVVVVPDWVVVVPD